MGKSIEGKRIRNLIKFFSIAFLVSAVLLLASKASSGDIKGALVETTWLAEHMKDPDLVIVDTSPTKLYLEKHIENAVSAAFSEKEHISYGKDVSYGAVDLTSDPNSKDAWAGGDGSIQSVEKAVRSMGINNHSKVVIYDMGGLHLATKFFWVLEHHGHKNLHVLNGGLSKWIADGFPVTREIPAVSQGDFSASIPRPYIKVDTDYVLSKLYKPEVALAFVVNSAWYYGGYNAYVRPGHIPSSILTTYSDFFEKDKTWKPVSELTRYFVSLGIVPGKEIITYCGGGIAGSLGWFTLKHVVGYPNVKFYVGSLLEWQRDPRDLALHTYGNPHLIRDYNWVKFWGGSGRLNPNLNNTKYVTLDVRNKDKYDAGHIPYAVNIPVQDLVKTVGMDIKEFQKIFGASGIGPEVEVMIYDDNKNLDSSLMFWILEYAGHDFASILNGGINSWTSKDKLTSDKTIIAERKTKWDIAIDPKQYNNAPNLERRLIDEKKDPDFFGYPRIWLLTSSMNRGLPSSIPTMAYKQIPAENNINSDGMLKSAADLIAMYEKAGIFKQAEVVLFSDRVEEASLTYYILRTLGYPRVRVYYP